jgi:non-heme chloroperoxidase
MRPSSHWSLVGRTESLLDSSRQGGFAMPTITMKDGAKIFYKDWGAGQPVVFSHGWPLNADAWDEQLYFFASNGYRAIAHDRRGHGRSTQTWSGNDMNTYADDLAAVVSALNVNDAIHIGHSTGGGEVARYIARHGTDRVGGVVLMSAVVPGMLKSATNPDGLPCDGFDQIRAGLLADRPKFYQDLSKQFYGANRPGSKVSDGVLEQFWRISMQAGFKAAHDCVKAFSETDFTEDCRHIDVPTLVIHGTDDQIVPFNIGGARSAKMIKGATLNAYDGAPHGLMVTHRQQLHDDLLHFAREHARPEGEVSQTMSKRRDAEAPSDRLE